MSPRLPPTPKPSTELSPRRTPRLSIDSSFNIGPAAITLSPETLKQAARAVSAVQTQPLSPTSPFSLVPVEAKPQRRRASNGVASKRTDLVIGPPPTRQHPIIQMKPREVTVNEDPAAIKPVAGSKRKSVGVSAAKRKIARKTAHSEIERRRRSKMNDQFAKLKSMVPACQNQDMHKLAILEATTEYLAYLEEAIKVYRSAGTTNVITSPPTFFASSASLSENEVEEEEEEENDEDDVIMESTDSSPTLAALLNQSTVYEITDTEATHALLLLADHHDQRSPQDISMPYFKSKPISVRDLLH